MTASPAGANSLSAETRLGPVHLQVADLSRSVAYYEQVLGFRQLHHADGRVTLAAHGDDRPLVSLRELAGATPVPRRGRLGLYHFAILLPHRGDLARFVAHLVTAGIRVGSADHLVSEALYLNDPDGLGIEVYADRPCATWESRGGEVAMDSLPLDFDSLLHETGERQWEGMPAGTTVGHVHLHVDDLARAEEFFSRALGFNVTVRAYPGALFLSAGGYHHHLGVNTWAGSGAAVPSDGDARLLEWTIVVPDRASGERAAQALAAAGADVSSEDGAWRAMDPWGTPVRIVTA